MSNTAKFVDILKNFDALPDSALIHTNVVVALTGLSDRTIRHHPLLLRHYVSQDRYCFRVRDVRKLLSDGVNTGTIRLRVGPEATRVVAEVQSARSRAKAKQIIDAFDDTKMGDREHERFQWMLADALAELPKE